MILELLEKSQKVLILGFAREGQSTYRFLRKNYPQLEISLADQKPPDSLPEDFHGATYFGDDYLQSLSKFSISDLNICIKSPGISPHKAEIESAVKSGMVFTSHTQIFFEICLKITNGKNRIIGITGTKGKSTTSSLIYHVLHENSLPAVLVGNIGKPALDYIDEINKDTWVVMELSSYQLLATCSSPHIAVLQNIHPDHLDYHTDLSEYISAKQNLVRFQTETDYFIYNADCKLPRQTATLTPAQKLPFTQQDYDPAISTQLLGNHNKYNILPAVIIGQLLGLSTAQIYPAISSFQPLQTRLEQVGSTKGISFFADTLATIPEATIAAIDALISDVETLIAGGYERKQDYSGLAEKILDTNIKTLVLFPTTGQRIAQEVLSLAAASQKTAPEIFHVNSMLDAVNIALDHTASGKICLLSPAAPSFSLFKDYRDEHEQYENAIKSHSLDHGSGI